MLVVVDTNVLVSSLMSKNGSPAKIVSMILSGELIPCYDFRIISEYKNVLNRPKFGFSSVETTSLLDWFEFNGFSVVAKPIDDEFIDESDKKFYEVAKSSGAKLITGNLKHYPIDDQVLSVLDFLEKYKTKK